MSAARAVDLVTIRYTAGVPSNVEITSSVTTVDVDNPGISFTVKRIVSVPLGELEPSEAASLSDADTNVIESILTRLDPIV